MTNAEQARESPVVILDSSLIRHSTFLLQHFHASVRVNSPATPESPDCGTKAGAH
jgi:hypothetical protein